MKTLLLFGSLKKNGDTAALAGAFVRHLEGEVRTLSASSSISPCLDCRFCWSHPGCSIPDEMQDVVPYWKECDNVVLASPIWFSSLSGPLSVSPAGSRRCLPPDTSVRSRLEENGKTGSSF